MLDERDAFDYPQDYRRWVEAGRPSGADVIDGLMVRYVVDAPLDEVMAEAMRQTERWKDTLDWLAER